MLWALKSWTSVGSGLPAHSPGYNSSRVLNERTNQHPHYNMCAIFGCQLEETSEQDLIILRRIALESQIRGKHAFGVSFFKDNAITTIKKPESAETFLSDFDLESCVSGQSLSLIGHCRYSTSDLQYNQPLFGEKISIVHNGVVDQNSPDSWSKYGYPLTGKNDSELILRALEAGEEPMMKFKDSSIAVLELRKNGSIRFYRNGKRPLWKVNVKNGFFLTSTKDIAIRSGLGNPERCVPGVIYSEDSEVILTQIKELIPC